MLETKQQQKRLGESRSKMSSKKTTFLFSDLAVLFDSRPVFVRICFLPFAAYCLGAAWIRAVVNGLVVDDLDRIRVTVCCADWFEFCDCCVD